jgi:DNA topoisomerase-1
MRLVVVESPAKEKTIEKYLGKDYQVIASYGHIVDLPKSSLGVDIDKNFNPKYLVSNRKALSTLKKAFRGKKTLVLAVDPDREGEAIGWHVAQKLGVITEKGMLRKGYSLERIVFTSITKEAILEAIEHPRKIDMNLVNAQQARRILDRLVGYKLSPLLWKKIQYGLSAGRVQSVALRLIVEREEEREAFKSEEYWKIKSFLTKRSNKEIKVQFEKKEDEENKVKTKKIPEGILFELSKISNKKPKINNQKEAKEIITKVKDKEWKISDISSKEAKRYPKSPFTTSTLQQTASTWFGMSARQTMRIAQKLYEKGFITYMRTDSTNISSPAIKSTRSYISKNFGSKYLPQKANKYKTKAKVAQEAHEAIRPTDFTKTARELKLTGNDLKLYRIIWQRTIASQMVPSVLQQSKINITIKEFLFSANGQRMIFDGYLKVYPEKFTENILPNLENGDILYVKTLLATQHFTQPPARYSEATLIKALESYGIGRPSTYVPIISTIQQRRYVEKENGYLSPTVTGRVVTHLLKDHFPNIVDYDFTAQMENKLDDIANGDKDWVSEIKTFYIPFEKELAKKEKDIDRETYTYLGEAPKNVKCPECGGRMKKKLGRYGSFYSCIKWPDCKGMLGIDGKTQDDLKKEESSSSFMKKYKSAPKTDDGRKYLLKQGRFGKFWAHPDYPKVKDAQPLLLKEKCPECGKSLVERKGKGGRFFIGCSGYPKCRYIKNSKDKSQNSKSKQ